MVNRKVPFLLVSGFCLLLSAFTSCQDQQLKPSASGKTGELLIVMDSVLWNGLPGQILRDSLGNSYPGLPQHEPLFRMVHIHPTAFKNILLHHRNVLIVDTGSLPQGRNYSLTFKEDSYAKPQLVMHLRAKDSLWLESAMLVMTGTVIGRFTEVERTRAVSGMSKLKELNIAREVKSHLGIGIPLTDDYFVARKEHGYVWLRKETIHNSTGIQVYRFPYTSDSAFTVSAILRLRDSLSARSVPGPSEGSYMVTDSIFPVMVQKTTINNNYAIMIRGLWRVEGDFMGGPFLSFLIHDRTKEELIFIDAFLYAPRFDKREYIKQMEAMAHAITF